MPSGAAVGAVVPAGAKKKAFRPDIQGLRMIAVVAVILDHLILWPSGGFAGVDIFFVISGFLITSLLLREHEKTGRISFVEFYRRRIKRIIPAASLVIVSTITAAFFLFNTYRAQQTAWDGVWATLFAANWRFATVGTDYFQSDGAASPLQHYWSLSVEEQFYFVWPWVMLAIFVVLGRYATKHARTAVLAAIVVLSIASFAWSIWETANNPAWAYFSTLSRAWELGVGATIAVASAAFASIPRWLRPVLGWMGLTGIVASLFVINSSLPFPGPWALFPVLSTALVIIAGTGGEQRFVWPIMNPVSSYIGDISYSLYLWHWPLIVFLAPFFVENDPVFYAVCAIAIVGISVLSYHCVEDPIRRSKWLEPKPRRRRRRRGSSQRTPLATGVMYSAVAALAAGTFALCAIALTPPRPSTAPFLLNTASTEPTAQPADVSASSALEVLQSDVRAAVDAQSWPQFDPPIDNLADQRVPQWTDNGCIDVTDANIDLCAYGAADSGKVAVVLGDSIATSWLPAVIGALEPLGYRVQALTMQGCPIALTPVYPSQSNNNVYAECTEHQGWAAAQVARIQPSLILMSDSFLSLRRLASGATGAAAQSEWEVAYADALAALPGATPKIALMAPPGAKNMQECYTPVSAPSDCARQIAAEWKSLRAAERASAEAAGAHFIDTQSWFCLDEICPSFGGRTAVYADSGHLTGTYSSRLAPVLSEALAEAGLPLP